MRVCLVASACLFNLTATERHTSAAQQPPPYSAGSQEPTPGYPGATDPPPPPQYQQYGGEQQTYGDSQGQYQGYQYQQQPPPTLGMPQTAVVSKNVFIILCTVIKHTLGTKAIVIIILRIG